MTLSRQLVIAISMMFLAMLVGVETIHLKSANAHLQDQLESHAQDAATSLGLSLGILLNRGDYAIAETVINAAFDRGNYARIELTTLDKSEPVVSRRMPEHIDVSYPAWFAQLFPLSAPTAESLVSTGWTQLGKVRVTSHPRFAYEQLWNTARNTLVWLILIYAVALTVLYFFLRNLLRPLTAIETAADAISKRNFVTIADRPATRELARVVAAMNLLSTKVRDAFESETARAAALQQTAYLDAISGTLNRRGFTEQFTSRYKHARKSFAGTFALVQLTNLAQVNESFGQQRADDMLRAIGTILTEAAQANDGLAARWMGGTLALVISPRGVGATEDAQALLAGVLTRARTILAELGLADTADIRIGAVHADAARPDLDDLVAQAGDALQAAMEQGAAAPELRAVSEVVNTERPMSPVDIVRANIENGNLVLMGQPALSIPGGMVLHREILARLPNEAGQQLNAAEFMPLVTRHGLSVDLDRAVIRKVLLEAARVKSGSTIAINLSPEAVADESFIVWLEGMMGSDLRSRMDLVFELSEHGVVQNEAAAQRFAERITKRGAQFAIDHFGVHKDSLALVQRLHPAYIKLSAVHTGKLGTDPGTRFFIEAVVRAAKQLDVPVIGQRIEDEATVRLLEELGFGGYQGFVAGRPTEWPEGK